MAAAHAIKSLLKMTARLPYWEHVAGDPLGAATASGILDKAIQLAPLPAWRDPLVTVLSLALICGAGATVGFVLGLQLYNTLSRFGAEESLGTVVGLSLIRELGPVLTGLLVTGRAGSATTCDPGATDSVIQTLPPMTLPVPITVLPPRIVVPA